MQQSSPLFISFSLFDKIRNVYIAFSKIKLIVRKDKLCRVYEFPTATSIYKPIACPTFFSKNPRVLNRLVVLIKNRNFLRGLRRRTVVDKGDERHRDPAWRSISMRRSNCSGAWRMIKRRGMIKWVIDSNEGQRVTDISFRARGQIRLAYPSPSSSLS